MERLDQTLRSKQNNYLKSYVVVLRKFLNKLHILQGLLPLPILWSGLAQYMQKHHYEIMLGCASIPMGDGGHFAASLYNSLSNEQIAPVENHAFPRLPLPLDRLNGGLEVEPPPLIKGYLKLGAKICSAPAWDPDFNTADVLTMLRLSEINPRYAKHFLGL